MPQVYNALTLDEDKTNKLVEPGLTFEVQQQLGDGVVRTIAMGSSDGLRRGMSVTDTGDNIMVPVGPGVLGRVMDVLGRPIDERGRFNLTKGEGFINRRRNSTSCRRRSNCLKQGSKSSI